MSKEVSLDKIIAASDKEPIVALLEFFAKKREVQEYRAIHEAVGEIRENPSRYDTLLLRAAIVQLHPLAVSGEIGHWNLFVEAVAQTLRERRDIFRELSRFLIVDLLPQALVPEEPYEVKDIDLDALIDDNNRIMIRNIFGEFRVQFQQGEFLHFDRLIGSLKIEDYSTDVLVALATVGHWARPQLGNRADFARRVDELIKDRNEPEDYLMLGLL